MKVLTYSNAKRCFFKTLVVPQLWKAFEAASTALSNSSAVVSGTLDRRVCVDGSKTSIHLVVVLSLNSPSIKFLAVYSCQQLIMIDVNAFLPVPPKKLVPFHCDESCSARSREVAVSPGMLMEMK